MLSILLTHKLCSFCVYLIGNRDVGSEKMTATQKRKPQRVARSIESLLEKSSILADHFKLIGVWSGHPQTRFCPSLKANNNTSSEVYIYKKLGT